MTLTHQPFDRSKPWQVTGPFGETTPPWSSAHPHMGKDDAYANCEGADAYAMGSGVAVAFTNDGSFGIGVCIELDEPLDGAFRYLLYAHLRDQVVFPGMRVAGGQLIGHVGHTSTASIGAHLHRQLCVTRQFPRNINLNADPDLYLDEEADMTIDEVHAAIAAAKASWNEAEVALLGSTQLQATEALVKRQRAMGAATTLAEVIAANDPNSIPG